MSTERKVWVHDLEQFENFHSGTFMNRDDTEEVRVFVICESRNDSIKYNKFLKEEVAGLIGFNNINFDYPILHFFMAIMQGYLLGSTPPDARTLNMLLSEETNRIINAEYSSVSPRDVKIPQLDLYRIHHFDNKAKRTSLKAVEIAINFPNVQDLPFEPNHIVQAHEIEQILSYNLNDVKATHEFYIRSISLIELRKKLGSKYNINLRNYNDPKIGQEIFGREIAKKKNVSYRYLKEMRTHRHHIDLKECVLDNIHFKSNEFNKILSFFKSTTITTTYKAFEKSVIYKGFKYDYGTGGIHGCVESGVYESDNEHIIIDIDVAAYYPSLAIVNNFYPRHLGPEFVEVYDELFQQRMIAKKEGDKATNSGLKLALNGAYGKSNDVYSLFYDPMYTMKITINGQLLLSMLAERLTDEIKNITMLQINTDGITVKIPRNQYSHVTTICKSWEADTNLILEFAEYKKMIIRDVNNYLAQTIDGKPKAKGCFEIIPTQNGATAYNKNWSMRVVPKALHAYYLENKDIRLFIHDHHNIYDFCIGFRARPDWNIYYTSIINSEKVHNKQQRTIRYYMSKTGGALTKKHKYGNRTISLESGRSCIVFNQYESRYIEDYKIDYNYYITQVSKIKSAVNDGQLKIF